MEREKHVQRLTKAENARAAGNAGTDLLKTYNMQNTKDGDELRARAYARFAFRFVAPSVKPKIQASSGKPQAPSSKRQASSRKRQAS
jgi:hypothetical protein